jgi:hypothetical protein
LSLKLLALSAGLLAGLSGTLVAADNDAEDYKIRIDGAAWFGKATGNFQFNGDAIDVNQDVGLGSTVSPVVGIDFKPWRKHHFFFNYAGRSVGADRDLTRTITFNGQTFLVGTSVNTDLRWNTYAFGYQYDIVRRSWGHIGIAAQLNTLDMRVRINASASASGSDGSISTSGSAERSLVAPIPVFGPDVRVYLVPRKVFVAGNVKGMYLFGYGNYIEGQASLGVNLSRHATLFGGYLLEGRTVVHAETDRLGVRVSQAGGTAGLEFRF